MVKWQWLTTCSRSRVVRVGVSSRGLFLSVIAVSWSSRTAILGTRLAILAILAILAAIQGLDCLGNGGPDGGGGGGPGGGGPGGGGPVGTSMIANMPDGSWLAGWW